MASQLQASKVQGNSVPHPYTIPSILYSAEEAGGFSDEDIYEIGQKGLNVLQQEDVRFKNYIIGKNRRNNDAKFSYNISDLFGHKEEIDRESLDKDDTAQIKASISSYLRLLVDYMQFPAALDTVEYLLRMYKIHIYDWEDLVLCSLPYHYKPECHRIVQLVCPIGNSKWDILLDLVKNSDVLLPRSIIIEKCLVDMQILNTLCEYACETRTKKYPVSKTVFMFSAAVIVGAIEKTTTVDEEIFKPILLFLDRALPSGGLYEAVALMIIGLLAKQPLIETKHLRFMTLIVKTTKDTQLQLSIMTLISFVQLQSVTYLRKSLLVDLIKIKDFATVLLDISKEFNISIFLDLLLGSILQQYDTYEHRFSEAFASILETVPLNNMVDLTSKVLSKCMIGGSWSGQWARTVLLAIHDKYPDELWEAVEKFLDSSESEFLTEQKLEMMSKTMDFLGLDKGALGVDYKTELLKCLRGVADVLRILREGSSSSSQDKRKLNVDHISIELFGKICEELVRDSAGNASLVIAFNVLEDLVIKMDTSSIASIFQKLFGHCLAALDVRDRNPDSMQNNDDAERSIIDATASLMERVSESQFKLLFQRSIDWAESRSGNGNKSIDRAILFYGLVNRLSAERGSIFVPCLREILDQIISHLTEGSVSSRRGKKAKTHLADDGVPLKSWHLRPLVVSFLRNCFLNDTGSVKFLDTNNFQVLLKPIVSQLIVEPPSSLKEHPHVPSVDEVDDWLVSCIGQMAVASGSDLLWKQLNHEVLMQTRSEKLRSRIVSLRN